MSRAELLFIVTVPLAFAGALLCLAPIKSGFQFGGDEGHELMKALLVSRGHPLYTEIWNDQPPLYTEIIAAIFRLAEPSAFIARLVTIGFSVLLLAALCGVILRASGFLAASIAILLLGSSAYFLELSVSAMLEIPALSLGMCALWAASRYSSERKTGFLAASGILFGF